jgi:hypothetical protein
MKINKKYHSSNIPLSETEIQGLLRSSIQFWIFSCVVSISPAALNTQSESPLAVIPIAFKFHASKVFIQL